MLHYCFLTVEFIKGARVGRGCQTKARPNESTTPKLIEMFGSCDGQPLNQNRNGKTEMLFIDKENARHTESRDETNTVSEP